MSVYHLSKGMFVQGVFRHGTGVDMDLPRLGGLMSHLTRDVIEQFPEMVSVVIDADTSTIEVPRCHVLEDKIPKLLHMLLLTFRLGPEAALKVVRTPRPFRSLSAQQFLHLCSVSSSFRQKLLRGILC